jgi:peptidoglycan/LPS O-acetylase OafA/YrhL
MAASFFSWFSANYWLMSRFDNAAENPGSWPLIGSYGLAALGCVFLLVAFLGAGTKQSPSWAIYLGRISFGLYVYHEFAVYFVNRLLIEPHVSSVQNHLLRDSLTVALNLVLPIGLTIPVAALSYRYLETPFLKMKRRHAVIESQPVGAASAPST